MPADLSDVNVTRAFATLRALAEACEHKDDRELGEKGLLQLLGDHDAWFRELPDWSFAEDDDLINFANPLSKYPRRIIRRFIRHASRAQKEVVVDSVYPIYIEGLRRSANVRCPRTTWARWKHAEKILVDESVYKTTVKDYKQVLRDAARRAALIRGGLAAAQARAAERTYAPGGAGAREAGRSFRAARSR